MLKWVNWRLNIAGWYNISYLLVPVIRIPLFPNDSGGNNGMNNRVTMVFMIFIIGGSGGGRRRSPIAVCMGCYKKTRKIIVVNIDVNRARIS